MAPKTSSSKIAANFIKEELTIPDELARVLILRRHESVAGLVESWRWKEREPTVEAVGKRAGKKDST